ncbi:MAG: translesion error-prone DNA polymerase V autoproteolytic subunit [Magnetococcales bacterium]|nr:translesion error-prone DNA polymerase V autoproteolytic subunit [Magnetococcales bacterium]
MIPVHTFLREWNVPLLRASVAAGFPSPAQDEATEELNLEQLLIEHREATFFWRVVGNSMIGEGIHHGDLLIVDRSSTPDHGSIVIAILDGGFVVKQFVRHHDSVILRSSHPDYPEILITQEQNLVIWGVVKWSIHRVASKISR